MHSLKVCAWKGLHECTTLLFQRAPEVISCRVQINEHGAQVCCHCLCHKIVFSSWINVRCAWLPVPHPCIPEEQWHERWKMQKASNYDYRQRGNACPSDQNEICKEKLTKFWKYVLQKLESKHALQRYIKKWWSFTWINIHQKKTRIRFQIKIVKTMPNNTKNNWNHQTRYTHTPSDRVKLLLHCALVDWHFNYSWLLWCATKQWT